MLKPLELTLAIIKPHVVANPIALADIRQMIISSQFKIVCSKRKKLSQEDACNFYKEHENKFFYSRLVTFMTSGPLDLYVMARHDAIKHWRTLMGPTKVFRAQFSHPDTIRGTYGLSDTRNATHGSDSCESVRKEIAFFFPDFNITHWYKHEAALFEQDLTGFTFNQREFLHELKK